jgi:CheY-like chemotaxis protein
MEAVGQLTGGLAHDFNNLLAVITGSLELLEMRIAKGRFNDVERFITASQTAAKRASSLTHRLLAFSRRQTLDPLQTSVNVLVNDMADLIRRTVGPEITVELKLTPDLWTTPVDPSQLENALLNLCINGRDAMPEGGRIMIETANRAFNDQDARLRKMTAGDYVALSITDNGTGMPPEVVARVFEPFFTTKPMGQGTGLGLSMVYGFARQSEGQVRIHSEVGKGTTVSIYLPRSTRATEAVVVAPVAAPARADAGQTVLIVDDEQSVRMLIVDVLEELGYVAVEAGDGTAGLRVLQSDLRIDLLITDVGMPGMNGRQLADAGRALRPNLRVLYITGYAEVAAVSHGHLEPGMAVIAKPFALHAVANKIRSLIDGE